MSRDPRWLTEDVRVPRGIALIFIALGVLTLVDWGLKAFLWFLQHVH